MRLLDAVAELREQARRAVDGGDGTRRASRPLARRAAQHADAQPRRRRADRRRERPRGRRARRTDRPASGPRSTSSSAAVSRTLRVTTNSAEKPLQRSPSAGPNELRPRVGLSPTRPHMLAGPRIEPPPSLACAAGTMPAATAAAAPPLEPPALCAGFHGLRVGPYASGSVVGSSASSGVLVRPSETRPAASKRLREVGVLALRPAGVAQEAHAAVVRRRRPRRRRCPSSGRARRGTGRAGRSAAAAAARARSSAGWMTAFSCGFSRSRRAMAASTSSRGETSPRRTSSAWAVASRAARSSDMRRGCSTLRGSAERDRRRAAHAIQPVKPTKSGMVRLSSMRSGSISKTAAASAISERRARDGGVGRRRSPRRARATRDRQRSRRRTRAMPSMLRSATISRRPQRMPTSAESGSAIASV